MARGRNRQSLFIMAGEASGDALGAQVMSGLKQSRADFDIFGVGGAAMQARGLKSLIPMNELTVIGFGAIPSAILRLNRRANELIDAIMARRPEAVVTIDNKGFAMRFARRLKKRMKREGWHAPVIHIVAPTVWAWGGWRANTVAASVDHLLCLFPFEESYFTDRGIDVTVVGHPAAESRRPAKQMARRTLGIGGRTKLLALLPGSRKSEVASLLPDMLKAFGILHAQKNLSTLKAVIPVAASVAGPVREMAASMGGNGVHLVPQSALADVLAAADYGMLCSGTATLEAALSGLDAAVYYRPDVLTRLVAFAVAADRSKAVLANAVTGKKIYPDFVSRPFTPESMAAVARPFLSGRAKSRFNKGMREMITESVTAVSGGFGRNAARAIMGTIRAARKD